MYIWGIFPTIAPIEPKNSYNNEPYMRSREARREMQDFRTIRLVLSIPVTEIFYVKDELTGNLIQGSEEAVKNIHEVMYCII
jgi:hypothetical protein